MGRTSKALAEAEIGEDARAKILPRNAEAMMSRLAKSRNTKQSPLDSNIKDLTSSSPQRKR